MGEKGKIGITLKNGKSNFISNVFYVSNLYHNLLSFGQQSEKRYNLRFKYGIGIITNNHLELIVKVYMNLVIYGLYYLIVMICLVLILLYLMILGCDTWHFGHLNFESLSYLARKNMVYGLPSIDFLLNSTSLVF